MNYLHIISLLFLSCCLNGQQEIRHLDFLGAGHDNNVIVSASSNSFVDASSTVDGFSIQNNDQLKDASRFLAQATFGADYPTICMTAAMGKEAWLEEQFSLPEYSYHDEVIEQTFAGYGFGYRLFGSTWMTNNLTTPDILRQRMNFNLSQIMVMSGNTMMIFQRTDAHPLSAYYDLLQKNSFGQFYNLLLDVSLSPQMGHFLSHYNNPKEDPENNIHPDENYAREIMQLFSIGLWELNPDGSRKKDAVGNDIPTYENKDIKEMAQVFTGLGPPYPQWPFGNVFPQSLESWNLPMGMYNDFHDTSEKVILDKFTIPANQDGMDDIEQAVLILSQHPNTAPFICKKLIQMFTTSNPSPEYIRDVVEVFNPEETGNFKIVITAILMHPEARACSENAEDHFGKLREPLVRMMNLLRAFPMSANINGDFWNFLRCPVFTMGQAPLQAPSVFNFYSFDYSPQGSIGDMDLLAPEFQLLTAPNTIGIINDVNTRAIDRIHMEDGCGIFGMFEPTFYSEDISLYEMDYSSVNAIIEDTDKLINRLDIILANGQLSEESKQIISNAVNQLDDDDEKLKMAIYGILISPDYAILK